MRTKPSFDKSNERGMPGRASLVQQLNISRELFRDFGSISTDLRACHDLVAFFGKETRSQDESNDLFRSFELHVQFCEAFTIESIQVRILFEIEEVLYIGARLFRAIEHY